MEAKSLTLESLSSMFDEIFKEHQSKTKKINVVRFCKTNGHVTSGGLNMNLCDDPTCESCKSMRDAIEIEFKKLTQ